jgi:hypothetical protein
VAKLKLPRGPALAEIGMATMRSPIPSAMRPESKPVKMVRPKSMPTTKDGATMINRWVVVMGLARGECLDEVSAAYSSGIVYVAGASHRSRRGIGSGRADQGGGTE